MADVMRQAYRKLSDAEVVQLADIKTAAAHLYDLIGAAPASRETSLAKTKIEEAVMWAVKGLTA